MTSSENFGFTQLTLGKKRYRMNSFQGLKDIPLNLILPRSSLSMKGTDIYMHTLRQATLEPDIYVWFLKQQQPRSLLEIQNSGPAPELLTQNLASSARSPGDFCAREV